MELDLKRLQQVMVVARVGSFSRAAEELHITQPALSRSIALLEERYGMRIFERGRGGAVLTEVGKLAVAEADALLRDARSLEHNFRLYGTGEGGRIAFGMGPLLASMILPDLSVYFINARPELTIKSVVKSAEALYDELMDDRIEILFCAGGQLEGEKDIVREDVGVVNRSVVVRPGHPLTAKNRVTSADVSGFTLLSAVDMAAWEGGDAAGAFICDNYHILRHTVLHTDAVWMTSSDFVAEELKQGRLCALAIADDPLETAIAVSVISRSGNRLSPAAIAVRDFVSERLARA